MKFVMISGHLDLTQEEFDLHYKSKIDIAYKAGCGFVVGDARGADSLAQKYLSGKDLEPNEVYVFHMFDAPRNNIGNFKTVGCFTSDGERDAAMTYSSSYDILWIRPGRERSGTAKNLMRRLADMKSIPPSPSKKTLYVDLDGVCADYDAAPGDSDGKKNEEGLFAGLQPITGAIDAIQELSTHYDLYFLSTAPWSNPNAWREKRLWVEQHFGPYGFKKLILSHNKGLLRGDFLIDDRTKNGVLGFQGKHIHFGTESFPDWKTVLDYLIPKDWDWSVTDDKEFNTPLDKPITL